MIKNFFLPYCHHFHSTPSTKAPALLMQEVVVSYGTSSVKTVLEGVSLKVERGTSTALVGSNGAGKSTLFKVAAHLMHPSSGSVHIFGHPAGACHHRVAYLPQRSDIDWDFPVTVLELVLMGRYVYLGWMRLPAAKDRTAAWEALEVLGIESLAHRQISQLSGGEQQRVLIARALAQGADLLLLDEPLNAVDADTRQIVQGVLTQLKAQGKTVIVATHYYKEEEGLYDEAIYLKEGKICSSS